MIIDGCMPFQAQATHAQVIYAVPSNQTLIPTELVIYNEVNAEVTVFAGPYNNNVQGVSIQGSLEAYNTAGTYDFLLPNQADNMGRYLVNQGQNLYMGYDNTGMQTGSFCYHFTGDLINSGNM